ncbi:hypothetical protein chiPu_0021029 [Chiloscyllium punctatum]|uniref:Uncharacterized protein n=1 Tax=Chiloscyllium punctatum TaxID=137246 RepID=A0A401RM98_CHIPU|nr:hypothetical protein [Chiloscyllium punctatum]
MLLLIKGGQSHNAFHGEPRKRKGSNICWLADMRDQESGLETEKTKLQDSCWLREIDGTANAGAGDPEIKTANGRARPKNVVETPLIDATV